MPDWSRIHRETGFGPWTCPLALFSFLYGLGVRLRLRAYDKGVFSSRSLPGFVVSVGNLTAGGTGKTPAVAMLAGWALDQGYRVAILSRGYGAQNRQEILEVSNGKGKYADIRMAGDEPSLLARAVPGSPVVISRDRYRAGRYAHRKFGSDFFILDDGFQHRKLKRDLDLVLIDAAHPFGNGRLLPWGPLREPLNQLCRADAIILTRFRRVTRAERGGNKGGKIKGQGNSRLLPPMEDTLAFVKGNFPSIPVFLADHEPSRVVFPARGETHDPGFLRKKRVVAFAGIAQPRYFEKTLIALGADVIRFRRFKDHYLYTGEDIDALIRIKEKTGASCLLTTEKDWMRIISAAPGYGDLAYLSIRFRLHPGHEAVLRMISDGFRE